MLRPLFDRVVVQEDPYEETTKSGLVLIDRPKDVNGTYTGTVLAVGPGKLLPNGTRVDTGLKKGDRVIFTETVGTKVLLDDTAAAAAAEDENGFEFENEVRISETDDDFEFEVGPKKTEKVAKPEQSALIQSSSVFVDPKYSLEWAEGKCRILKADEILGIVED